MTEESTSGPGQSEGSWWAAASTGQRRISVAIGIVVGVAVVAIGIAAAVVVGQSLLHPGIGPYPMPGPDMDAALIRYGLIPVLSLTGVAAGIASGLGAARLSIWLAHQPVR